MIKLSKFANDLKVTKKTLWNWKDKGLLKFHKIGSMNYVDQETYNKFLHQKTKQEQKVIIYCRVSSTVNKSNLETQKQRLTDYCAAKGYKVDKIITEFGSGLNDKRPKLQKILEDGDFTKIVIEHKDRLTRFGFNYLEILLKSQGKSIEVINNVETDREDIIQDFVSIITSFSARIYGQRRSKRKTEKLIKHLENNENEV
jgi:putative resolvase